MYQPRAFVADAEAAAALITEHPLAQLVVSCADGLLATPVPLLRRGDSLVGHLARPNSLWRQEGAALAIFTGVQAYVSPNWYPSKREDGKAVPTWNYETVHVHGTLVAHDDPEWKRAVLELQTERFEGESAVPWRITDAPTEYISTMISGVVGIELTDLRIEGKAKLSQNRSEPDRLGVIAGLTGGSPAQQDVADAMRVRGMPDSPS